MRIGIVDIGSLSLRFDIFEVLGLDPPALVHRYRSMPRLGEQLVDGKISEEGMARLTDEFKIIRTQADQSHAARIFAVGTSALRDAKNADQLLESILKHSSIHIRILSGAEEAALTSAGIFANDPLIGDSAVFVDIGGGSTEITFTRDRAPCEVVSADIGALRLMRSHFMEPELPEGTFPTTQIEKARAHIRERIAALNECARYIPSEQLVGSSGTARTLERLNVGPGRFIEKERLESFIGELSRMNKAEVLAIPGMEKNRADVILPGALILDEIMNVLKAPALLVTFFSLRHGVLNEAWETMQRENPAAEK